MNERIIKALAEKEGISMLYAETLVNHCVYLMKRLMREWQVDEAVQLAEELLGMSFEEILKVKGGE